MSRRIVYGITYQPVRTIHWGCEGCSAIGHFDEPIDQTCDATAAAILEAHSIASPECKAHPFVKTRDFEPVTLAE
jgi:hypothetical protein